MAKAPKKYQRLALELIENQKGLKKVQRDYERMSRLQYSLPDPLQRYQWIRPIISTAPYDALRGATRALSNLKDALDIHPITVYKALPPGTKDESLVARTLANEWETALKWQLERAEKRRKPLAADVVWSCAVYGEVIGQLIHVPTQMKLSKSSQARKDAALRFGDWATKLADPKTVYPRYSDYMTEAVLSVNIRTGRELLDFWGDEASFVKDEKNGVKESFLEFEYVDYDGKIVWASHSTRLEDTNGEVILPLQPWLKDQNGKQVPFLPWFCSAGGTTVDTAPEFQRKPLLFPILQAESWASANIMGTIAMSKALATANAPEQVLKGPGAEDVAIDYTQPGGRLNLTALQEYQQLQQRNLDPKIISAFDRLESAIQRATVADVLVTAQPISGEQAFASYNLQVSQAIASLGEIKEVAQGGFNRLFEAMLLVTHYTGGEIEGYGPKGEYYSIDSEDIDPDAIYLSTELKADVPSDRQQRAITAVQMVDKLPYSPIRLLRYLGDTDPEGSYREYKLSRLDMADFQARVERLQRELSGQYKEDVLAAAKMLHQQMMAQPQAEQAPEEEPMRPGLGIEGQGVNPAAGGRPPAEFFPQAATFEGATGRTRRGQEVVGV